MHFFLFCDPLKSPVPLLLSFSLHRKQNLCILLSAGRKDLLAGSECVKFDPTVKWIVLHFALFFVFFRRNLCFFFGRFFVGLTDGVSASVVYFGERVSFLGYLSELLSLTLS